MKTMLYCRQAFRLTGRFFLLLLAAFAARPAQAQLNPLGATYFQNPYIMNPAMAGANQGLELDLSARQQWTVLPGSPKTKSITAAYGSDKKAGVGFSLYNEEAGLIKNTRVMGTFAYHLPLDVEGQRLSFGISLGFMNERVMTDRIDGEPSDITVGRFNDRETFIDGDFGVAYTGKRFTAQFAMPNLKSFFKQEDAQGSDLVDHSGYFASVAYKFRLPGVLDGIDLEPMLRYRDIRGLDNIFDLGANILLADEKIGVLAMYHSSESFSIGMGVRATPGVRLHGMFTSGTADLAGYTNGNFELSLKVNLRQLKL